MTKLNTAQRRAVLEAYDGTLGREIHNLARRPETLWQQLYNRLQWEKDPVPGLLEPELHRRSGAGAAPWLRTRTRVRESEALRLTLSGHTGWVTACAISPDSDFIVTGGSHDRTFKIWDAATGAERATLTGHASIVDTCAISPDSTFIATTSHDKTCKIWDAATGKERATFAGHTDAVTACAISPDSTFVVTASIDKTCMIWDVATGLEFATLTVHTDAVTACAISPDSTFVVTASDDKTCRIWDADALLKRTGKERAILTGHTDAVTACAISPDSTFVATASSDHTCRVWDAATGEERASLPLLGGCHCVALQQWQPFAVCGGQGGNVYLIDLVGIEYGPIIVTAVDLSKGAGPALRCPKCFRLHPLDDAWLGKVIECPTRDCGLSLGVNPFVMRMGTRHRPEPPAERELQETVGPSTSTVATPGQRHWWSRR
jgi:hypothetical protein